MAESPPPASSTSPITSHTSVMFRNIIVGVSTTILGSTAVYFLGFHNKGKGETKASYLEMKESTTRAWRTYVAIDNIYYKNLMSINKDKELILDLDRYKAEMFKEGARFKRDAENIMKDKDVDKAFVSMMERRFEREKEAEEAITIYIDKLKAVMNSVDKPEEKQQQVFKETRTYQSKANGVLERTLNEMEDLAKTLSERYGQPFNLNEIQAYVDYKSGKFKINLNTQTGGSTVNNNQGNPGEPKDGNNNSVPPNPEIFPGKWSTTGANIHLKKDGTFFWDVLSTGDKSSGKWEIKDNQLIMFPSTGSSKLSTWIFNLVVENPNLFTMTLNVEPHNSYQLARIRE